MEPLNLYVPLNEYALVPERTLGGQHEIASRVSVGEAVPYPVTVDRIGDRPDLVEALRSRADSDFYVLSFVCSFLERSEERVEQATFGVELTALDDGPPPIAYSIDPVRRASRPVQVTRSVGIELGVHLAADLSLSGGHKIEYEDQPDYVTGAGERESDPEWDYRRTTTVVLGGPHDMTLVARVRAGASAKVTYGLSAQIARPRWGIGYARLTRPAELAELVIGPDTQ